MTIGYRENVKKIIADGETVPAFPSDFYSYPKLLGRASLSQAINSMNSPEPSSWYEKGEKKKDASEYKYFKDSDGITFDGDSWFLSCNNHDDDIIGIYKMDVNTYYPRAFIDLKSSGCNHIGAISYFNGNLYIACEGPGRIIIINTDAFNHIGEYITVFQYNEPITSFDVLPLFGESWGNPPQMDGNEVKCPWCAVNPWNELLYSSQFGDEGGDYPITQINAYMQTTEGFINVPSATIYLKEPAYRIQGGVFTEKGNLLLCDNRWHEIKCYSALNGHCWGKFNINVERPSFLGVELEELEGLSVTNNLYADDGIQIQIQTILYAHTADNWYHKYISVPDSYSNFL